MDSLTAVFWKNGRDGGSRTLQRAEEEEGEAEFTALVERQARFLYRVAYSVVRNAQDAEDVVQEAFLKLYRTGAWRGIEQEKAYLARVAWRIAVERLPKREMVDGVVEMLVAVGDSPEASALRGAEELQLRRLIDALPEELRQTLILSALEEMNSREVGLVMGIPEGTVRTRLMRARAELRKKFEAASEVRL
jgi:RNA polymerase sigma-70 factor (ECF subfamily)